MTLIFAIVAALFATPSPGDAAHPPKLTFDKPTDYIKWYETRVGKGKHENAFDVYKRLLPDDKRQGGLPTPEGEVREQLDQAQCRVWKAEDLPALVAFLKKCEPQLRLLQDAAKVRDFWQPMPKDLHYLGDHMITVQASCSTACKLLLARAWMKQDNQAAALIDACRIVLRNGDHMQQDGHSMGALDGMQRRGMVYQNLRASLDAGVVTGDSIQQAHEMDLKNDPGNVSWPDLVNLERVVLLDTLQYVCPGGKPDAARWPIIDRQFLAARLEAGYPFSPKEAARMIDEDMDQMIALGKKGPTLASYRKIERLAYERKATVMTNTSCFSCLNLPAISTVHYLIVRCETERRGTLLALAVHAYHAKHDKWPAKLDELEAKELKDIRIDPFSQKDFAYRLYEGKPFLYSIAADGEDNGGRHDNAWGRFPQGGDFVFCPYQR